MEGLQKYLYTDKCSDSNKIKIEELLGFKVIVRNIEHWNIDTISNVITNPQLKLIVIHDINEMSVSEMTLGSFMCKKVLITTKSINYYKTHMSMIDDIELSCDLTAENTSFFNWFKSYGENIE